MAKTEALRVIEKQLGLMTAEDARCEVERRLRLERDHAQEKAHKKAVKIVIAYGTRIDTPSADQGESTLNYGHVGAPLSYLVTPPMPIESAGIHIGIAHPVVASTTDCNLLTDRAFIIIMTGDGKPKRSLFSINPQVAGSHEGALRTEAQFQGLNEILNLLQRHYQQTARRTNLQVLP